MHTYRRFDTQQSNLDWCWSLKPCFPVFVCSLLYSVPLRRELCPGSVPGNYPGLFAEWWSFCFPSQLVCRVCRQPYACLVLHVSFFFISAFFTPPQTLVSIFLTACPGFPSCHQFAHFRRPEFTPGLKIIVADPGIHLTSSTSNWSKKKVWVFRSDWIFEMRLSRTFWNCFQIQKPACSSRDTTLCRGGVRTPFVHHLYYRYSDPLSFHYDEKLYQIDRALSPLDSVWIDGSGWSSLPLHKTLQTTVLHVVLTHRPWACCEEYNTLWKYFLSQ